MSSKNTAMHNLKNSIIRIKVFFDTCHESTQKTNDANVFIYEQMAHICLEPSLQ